MSLPETLVVEPANPGSVMISSVPTRSKRVPWIWAVGACFLLGISGAVRAVQDRYHQEDRDYVEAAPFPLKVIPTTLGPWRLIEGGERSIDDQTMKITGGSDYILRTYVDDLTGVSLTVLILFGPAEPVLPHTPQACFPASGYSQIDENSNHQIKTEDGLNASFRSAIYSKSGGRTVLREIAYHSFRLDGEWSPDIGAGRKFPRRNPGIFKVQVQRRIAEGERRDRNDPIEQFLMVLLPDIEKRVAEASASKASANQATVKSSQ